ncbi:integumentary mucin C.1-like [Sinocyclocheilus grahami]|uniref:integumentary mucin C.1-like n=1 Tax=Sinocyclocheilus grahami TaxID=75366 RepID=UPI0007AC9461|nr:PREDICTED: integumentary mucin C.1-like [Sinocyclocheilus grahami]
MEAQEAVVDTTAPSNLEAVTTTTARAPTTRVALDQLEATAKHSLRLTIKATTKATTRATTTKGTTMATTVNTQDTARATVKLPLPQDRPTTSSSRATINSTSSMLSSGNSTTRTRASGTSTITNTAITATTTSRAARAPREHSSSIAGVSDSPFPKQHSSCLFCVTQSYPFLPALCKRLFAPYLYHS